MSRDIKKLTQTRQAVVAHEAVDADAEEVGQAADPGHGGLGVGHVTL